MRVVVEIGFIRSRALHNQVVVQWFQKGGIGGMKACYVPAILAPIFQIHKLYFCGNTNRTHYLDDNVYKNRLNYHLSFE